MNFCVLVILPSTAGNTVQETKRHDRLIQERVHDTYKLRGKLAEPTVCPQMPRRVSARALAANGEGAGNQGFSPGSPA